MDTIDVASKFVVVDITTPKNTNALTTTFNAGNRIIRSVDVLFAPGHVGLTGIRFNYGGVTVLPWNQPTGFLVGDNERQHYELELYAPGPLSILTHNPDAQNSHRHVLTFELVEVNNAGALSQPIVTPVLLS